MALGLFYPMSVVGLGCPDLISNATDTLEVVSFCYKGFIKSDRFPHKKLVLPRFSLFVCY